MYVCAGGWVGGWVGPECGLISVSGILGFTFRDVLGPSSDTQKSHILSPCRPGLGDVNQRRHPDVDHDHAHFWFILLPFSGLLPLLGCKSVLPPPSLTSSSVAALPFYCRPRSRSPRVLQSTLSLVWLLSLLRILQANYCCSIPIGAFR
jgi:hypothetical protein